MFSFILLVGKFVKIFTPVWIIIKVIIRIFQLIVGRDNTKVDTKKEHNMFALSPLEASVIESMKESQDWITLTEKVEAITIEVFTDDKPQSFLMESVEVITRSIAECSSDFMVAVEGSSLIPAEFKGASATEWATLVVKFLVQQGILISGIWIKPAVKAK